jgi:hypothetical protein
VIRPNARRQAHLELCIVESAGLSHNPTHTNFRCAVTVCPQCSPPRRILGALAIRSADM